MTEKVPIANYEQLFDQIPAQYIIFGTDIPRFTVLAASDRYLETVGRTRQEVVGNPTFEVFPDTSNMAKKTGKGIVQLSIEKVIKTKKADSMGIIRYDIPNEEGGMDVHYWEIIHEAIFDEKGDVSGVVQINNEVTESVLADERLRLADLQLDDVLSAGLVGSWIWNIKKDVVIADKGLATLFGVSTKSAQLGLPVEVFINSIHPEDRERVGSDITATIKKGNSYESEYRTIDTKGIVRWVIARGRIERDEKGSPLRFPGVLVDITDRKLAEEKLLESEEQLRFMADAMPQLVFSTDEKGLPNYYNGQWYTYTGVTSKKAEDVVWDALFHPSDLNLVYTSYAHSIETGEPLNIEFRLYHAVTKKFRWVIGRALPFKDDQGKIVKWYGTLTDINDQKRLEKELKKEKQSLETRVIERTAQLEETNKGLHAEIEKRQEVEKNLSVSNQELQDFAYVASHDLQEPLRKIQAFGNLLETEYVAQLGEGVDYLNRMQNAASRMSILIQDLLSFSRVASRAQPIQRVDLSIVIPEVLVDLESRIEETKAKIVLKALPEVVADPTHMRQLFQNLIGNALKFHEPGKTPTVTIESKLSEDKSKYIIYVKDNGIGFDEKYLDRIFSVFQRLHGRESYEGTGIGLAVCRKIVERYGGTITAKSKKDEGAIFIVTLPVVKKG